MPTYKVGSAPWETGDNTPQSFTVGQAPWETQGSQDLSQQIWSGLAKKKYNPAAAMQDPSNPAAGVIKGLGSLGQGFGIAPFQTVGKVVGAVEAKAIGKSNESLSQLNSVTQRLIEAATHETDPTKKQALLDQAHKNLQNISEIAGQNTENLSKASDLAAGKISEPLKPHGLGQNIGYAAEKIGEFILTDKAIGTPLKAGITSATKALPTAARVLTNIVGRSGVTGGVSALVGASQGQNKDEVKKTALYSTLISLPFETFTEVAPLVANYLHEKAIKQATQSLGPTTKANKELAEKVVPEMLHRRVMFGSREGLAAKADETIDAAGQNLDDVYASLPPDAKLNYVSVLKKLEEQKAALVVKGTNVVPDAAKTAYRNLQQMEDEILKIAGVPTEVAAGAEGATPQIANDIENMKEFRASIGEEAFKQKPTLEWGVSPEYKQWLQDNGKRMFVTPGSIAASGEPLNISMEASRSYREILDASIKKAGKGFAYSPADQAALFATKTSANAVRGAIAEQFPGVAAANKEFTFWKNLGDVVGSTLQRTSSQGGGLSQAGGAAAGAITGAVRGSSPLGIIFTALGVKQAVKIFTSPAFRNTSAVIKEIISDAVKSGNTEQAIRLLNSIAVGASIGTKE